MTKPKVIKHWMQWTFIECPECGLEAKIDKDQYEGKVSIDCPECSYHETHDLR